MENSSASTFKLSHYSQTAIRHFLIEQHFKIKICRYESENVLVYGRERNREREREGAREVVLVKELKAPNLHVDNPLRARL